MAVRSRPYFSSDWKVSSGVCELTRWVPRTEQDMLGRNVFVAHAAGVALGCSQHIRSRPGQAGFPTCAVYPGPVLQLAGRFIAQTLDTAGYLGHDRWDNPLRLAQERQQQVQRLDALVVVLLCQALRTEQSFLRFLSIAFQVHEDSSLLPIIADWNFRKMSIIN
jgi:hypothetical protein